MTRRMRMAARRRMTTVTSKSVDVCVSRHALKFVDRGLGWCGGLAVGRGGKRCLEDCVQARMRNNFGQGTEVPFGNLTKYPMATTALNKKRTPLRLEPSFKLRISSLRGRCADHCLSVLPCHLFQECSACCWSSLIFIVYDLFCSGSQLVTFSWCLFFHYHLIYSIWCEDICENNGRVGIQEEKSSEKAGGLAGMSTEKICFFFLLLRLTMTRITDHL